ncbi:hypothetical protein D3C72_2278250 [compost metagenome]
MKTSMTNFYLMWTAKNLSKSRATTTNLRTLRIKLPFKIYSKKVNLSWFRWLKIHSEPKERV